mmetsp:Transcript_33851/g.78173  ORF Transcript_33851/g.78173 Transcript_33851/m.78173 type:complete len:257 (-) Transcript_33851:748-1518(-)
MHGQGDPRSSPRRSYVRGRARTNTTSLPSRPPLLPQPPVALGPYAESLSAVGCGHSGRLRSHGPTANCGLFVSTAYPCNRVIPLGPGASPTSIMFARSSGRPSSMSFNSVKAESSSIRESLASRCDSSRSVSVRAGLYFRTHSSSIVGCVTRSPRRRFSLARRAVASPDSLVLLLLAMDESLSATRPRILVFGSTFSSSMYDSRDKRSLSYLAVDQRLLACSLRFGFIGVVWSFGDEIFSTVKEVRASRSAISASR